MLQHHGDSQPALPHAVVRARERGAFPSESALLQGHREGSSKLPLLASGAGERWPLFSQRGQKLWQRRS